MNMLFICSPNDLGEFRAGTSAAWLGVVPAAMLGAVHSGGDVDGMVQSAARRQPL
ncbi:hypothetical protein CTP10_R81320 (plasmid) [Cupriavidus sp. P-10]|nr:hypothetical protein CTP10_R81320 [Cupriavidus sp. P-10]